jgi:predicted permease
VQAAVLDTRFALRTLRRRPLYAALAVGTLALGIGAATTIYGVVDGVLLEPLPFRESNRLVAVFRTFPHWRERENLSARWDQIWHSYPGFRDWQARQRSFDAVGAWAASQRTLTGLEMAEQVSVLRTSSSLLQVLDARPALGRFFLPGEDRPPSAAVAVISHEMWTTRFGASPTVIGRAVRLDDVPYEIVGVLPARLSVGGSTAAIWVPAGSEPSDERAGSTNFFAIGRLGSGVTLAQAADETRRLVADSAQPDSAGARLALWRDEMTKRARRPLLLLLGASVVLLLLACVNVATLMLGEASGRGDEFATRVALGAGRARVARQLLTESLVVAALGVAAGTLIAQLGTRALVALAPGNVPRLQDVQLDARVLAAACAAGAVTAILFGLVPAVSLVRASPTALLGAARRVTARRGLWTLRALVATQIALSCLLLIGAALLGSSLRRLSGVDPGFAAERMVLIALGVTGGRHAASAQATTAFFAEAAARIAAIPGVERAAVGSAVPFSGGGSSSSFTIDGYALPPGVAGIEARRSHVLPGFIETFGVRLLAGRTIDGRDRDGALPVAMVNETMARRFWPGESAIGKRVGYDDRWLTVVGVVSDVKHASLADSTRITVYMPAAQQPTPYLTLLVRAGMDAAALAPLARQAIATLDPSVPVTRVDAMAALVERSFASERFRTVLIGLFAALAAVLAAVGIYGVTARAVARQRREIGIRMALGSSARLVVGLFVRRAGVAVALGAGVGLVGAFAASRLLAPYLFATDPADPSIYAATTLLLTVVALAASWLPARRAARTNPASVLRDS